MSMLQTELGRIDTVMTALERSRPAVAAHGRRVAAYSVLLASQYGFEPHVIETLRLGALLHDVGKMLVPKRILSKPGRPTEQEWQALRIHPQLGVEMAHRSGFDDEICRIVLYHHERYDGRGYPDGLRREAIHFTVRIVSVMDALDALTSARNYRERLSLEAARNLVARAAGSRFCPWAVTGLLALPIELLHTIAENHPVQDQHPEGPVLMPPDQLAQPWRVAAQHGAWC
jgi:putative nucleotidyltransferase with HDIG domain